MPFIELFKEELMAVGYMTSVNISNYDPNIRNRDWEYDQTLVYVSVELTSNPIIIPRNLKEISVFLGITAGSGKIQYTLNKVADVISGTGVVWKDWDAGTVIIDTDDVLKKCSAIRFICTTGTVRLLVQG